MKLRRIAKQRWDVLALCDARGDCQILDFLAGLNPSSLAEKMLYLLRERVPAHGPPKNQEASRSLGDDIFEFKRRPKRGSQLRVLWFWDKNRVIVCTHAFSKTTKKTPRGEIDRARKLRQSYFEAKASASIEILTGDDTP